MVTLKFSPDAESTFLRLRDDPESKSLLERLREKLDALEQDPESARSRERRFPRAGVWGITVHDRHHDWLILWEPGPDDTVIVSHIVPDPFSSSPGSRPSDH